MYRVRYQIKAYSPLVISTFSGDMNMVRTENFIPGTIVLGLLANRFIDQQKARVKDQRAHENDTFYNWFLAGSMKINNAYIVSQDEYGEYPHYPTPFSVEQEKYGTTVIDRLITPDHSEQTEYVGNFCRLEDDTLWVKSVETTINFHHARDAEKGRPKIVGDTGVIFHYEAINRDQVFEGILIGEESELKNLLQMCGKQYSAFVGRSRNAQYGAVEFKILDEEPEAFQSNIAWPEDEESNPVESISMTLLSDLILYNECGYPTTDVDNLREELKKYLGEVEIQKAFVKKTEVENFVGIWQLKKPSETCFAASSTFLLKIDRDKLEQLAEIQQKGIGERTHEGFGRCKFGIQTHPTLLLRDEAEEEAFRKPPKPQESVPEAARKIVTTIIKDIVAERIELKAIIELDEFERLPSNALIARLEAMIKKADDHREFVDQVDRFRKIAIGQLEHCVSRENNLREFIAAAKPTDWKEFFRDPRNGQIKSLCEEIDLKLENDEQLKRELTRRYFTTFFSMMRKRAIAEREGYNGEK